MVPEVPGILAPEVEVDAVGDELGPAVGVAVDAVADVVVAVVAVDESVGNDTCFKSCSRRQKRSVIRKSLAPKMFHSYYQRRQKRIKKCKSR